MPISTYHISTLICRSEIHEKMNCLRCHDTADTESIHDQDGETLTNRNKCDEYKDCDIGLFAEIAGCLHKLKSSEKQVRNLSRLLYPYGFHFLSLVTVISFFIYWYQVGTPKEENLCGWGHHFSATTVPDIIFQASAGEEVWVLMMDPIQILSLWHQI